MKGSIIRGAEPMTVNGKRVHFVYVRRQVYTAMNKTNEKKLKQKRKIKNFNSNDKL